MRVRAWVTTLAVLHVVVCIRCPVNAEVAQQKEPTIRAIISDPTSPSTIYIGTDDGIAFTHDRGNTWIVHPFATPEHVLALARDPRDGMTIWAATETGFRRSGDRGVTWTTMTLPSYRVPLKARAAAKRFHLYSEELEKAAAGFAAGRYPVTGVLVIPGPAPVVLAAATGAGLLR